LIVERERTIRAFKPVDHFGVRFRFLNGEGGRRGTPTSTPSRIGPRTANIFWTAALRIGRAGNLTRFSGAEPIGQTVCARDREMHS
jgi:hypothetical protein